MSRLYCLDANGIGYWQHFAVEESARKGALIAGVSRWWKEFSERYSPEQAVACFDCSRESNWRKVKFVEYKAARDTREKDDVLMEGLRALPALFESLGVPVLRVEGFEADDLIATLSARHEGEVIVITSDKDMMQLVDDRVQVYDPRPNKANECVFYDAVKVQEKHGIPPHRLREFLAIYGDKSDSIPGVVGWGEVAALTAIQQTKSRLELLRKVRTGELKSITPKKQASFVEQIEAFELSYELVGLRFDAPLPEDFSLSLARI